MENDKGEEGSCLADGPRLVSIFAVPRVQSDNGGGVYDGDGQRHVRGQNGVVGGAIDGERTPPGAVFSGRRDRWRCCVRWELEDSPRGQFARV